MSDADDKEAVDRAFAELVAGYHLTADRPDPPIWDLTVREPLPDTGAVFEPPRPVADPDLTSLDRSPLDFPPPLERRPRSERHTAPEDRFEPEPPAPLPRPAWPVLAGWIGLGYAMLTIVAIAVGVDLPTWAAWAGVIGFVGGFGLLVSRLPRSRPPDAGDGAVL